MGRWYVGWLLIAGLTLTGGQAMAQSRAIWSGNGLCRDIALSYDVEFGSRTQDLADLVDELGIRTTWFFLGDSVDAYPGIVQQVARNHQIGNHTLNHPQMPRLSRAEMYRQLVQAEANIERVSGINPAPFWRPPYGEYNQAVLEAAGEAGYDYTMMWSIDTQDWAGPSAETIRRRLVDGAFPGAIALQHGSPPNTVEGTRLAVADLRARGYQFVTISEILGFDRHLRDFGGDTYVVQAGDSFDLIGRCHNVTGTRVAAYNEVTDLAPGDRFVIPHTTEVIIRVNGERQAFAVYPRVVGGSSVAHVRLAERLGAMVSWDGARVIVTRGSLRMEITPGERVARVNGAPVDMGAAAFMENDRVLVPVRFLSERLGYGVRWDQATFTVFID